MLLQSFYFRQKSADGNSGQRQPINVTNLAMNWTEYPVGKIDKFYLWKILVGYMQIEIVEKFYESLKFYIIPLKKE